MRTSPSLVFLRKYGMIKSTLLAAGRQPIESRPRRKRIPAEERGKRAAEGDGQRGTRYARSVPQNS